MQNYVKIFLIGLAFNFLINSSVYGEVSSNDENESKLPKVRLLDRDPCNYPKLNYCTELTDVQIGNYQLKIPFNLIGSRTQEKNLIELHLMWPKLTGLINGGDGEIYDVIRILIQTIHSEEPTEEGIQRYIHHYGLVPISQPELGLIEYLPSESINVYSAYVPIELTDLLPNKQPLFIKKETIAVGEYSLAIPDPAKGGISGTYVCSYGYTLRPNLFVSVQFYNRYLKDWKSIVTSSRDLVESFIKE